MSSHRSKLSSESGLRSSESSLVRLRHSPEHIYQSIGSDLGLSRIAPDSDNLNNLSEKIGVKVENHDSGRSVSPPPRRFFSREGSAESSGQTDHKKIMLTVSFTSLLSKTESSGHFNVCSGFLKKINIEVSKVGDSRLSLSVQFDDNRFHLIKLVFAESERDKKSGI